MGGHGLRADVRVPVTPEWTRRRLARSAPSFDHRPHRVRGVVINVRTRPECPDARRLAHCSRYRRSDDLTDGTGSAHHQQSRRPRAKSSNWTLAGCRCRWCVAGRGARRRARRVRQLARDLPDQRTHRSGAALLCPTPHRLHPPPARCQPRLPGRDPRHVLTGVADLRIESRRRARIRVGAVDRCVDRICRARRFVCTRRAALVRSDGPLRGTCRSQPTRGRRCDVDHGIHHRRLHLLRISLSPASAALRTRRYGTVLHPRNVDGHGHVDSSHAATSLARRSEVATRGWTHQRWLGTAMAVAHHLQRGILAQRPSWTSAHGLRHGTRLSGRVNRRRRGGRPQSAGHRRRAPQHQPTGGIRGWTLDPCHDRRGSVTRLGGHTHHRFSTVLPCRDGLRRSRHHPRPITAQRERVRTTTGPPAGRDNVGALPRSALTSTPRIEGSPRHSISARRRRWEQSSVSTRTPRRR